MSDFLKPFEEATKLISGSKYVSICLVLPIFKTFYEHLNDHKNSSNSWIKLCAENMLLKFDKYKDLLETDITKFAVILDPRLKLDFFENDQIIKQRFVDFFEKNYYQSTPIQIESSDVSFVSKLYKKTRVETYDEIEKYLSLPIADQKTEPLFWWKNNCLEFPNLSKFAFEILIIPASSVPSEHIFSKSGDLISQKRSQLTVNSVRFCMCLKSWIPFFANLK